MLVIVCYSFTLNCNLLAFAETCSTGSISSLQQHQYNNVTTKQLVRVAVAEKGAQSSVTVSGIVYFGGVYLPENAACSFVK